VLRLINFNLILHCLVLRAHLNVFEMELNANPIISSSCFFLMALNCVIFEFEVNCTGHARIKGFILELKPLILACPVQ